MPPTWRRRRANGLNSRKRNLDGLVKSPSAALRFMRSLRGEALRDLIPQFLRALQLELFTKPSFYDFLQDDQILMVPEDTALSG